MKKNLITFVFLVFLVFAVAKNAYAMTEKDAQHPEGVLYFSEVYPCLPAVNFGGVRYEVQGVDGTLVKKGATLPIEPPTRLKIITVKKTDGSFVSRLWKNYGVVDGFSRPNKKLVLFYTDGWYTSPTSGRSCYLTYEGDMLVNTVTPDGYTVGEDGAWIKDIPKQTVPANGGGPGLGNGSMQNQVAEDYSYLAETEFRSIKRQYPTATAQIAYVQPFTDINGDKCALVALNYKIVSNYSECIMYNLSNGDRIKDADRYYSRKADQYYGEGKEHFIDLSIDVLDAEMKAQKALLTYLESGQITGTGALVTADVLNL